jgi:uncharacterized protein (TIGR00730 family)
LKYTEAGILDDALRKVRDIFSSGGNGIRTMLYKNIILNALECQSGELDILDLKIIERAVAEFQHAACVFKPYRSIRKVSVFGSAWVTEDNPNYQLAVDFGRAAVEKNFMVVTGAGPEKSFGVNILLPKEQAPAKVIQDDPKLVTFKYFFTRKVFFVMEADAIVLFPGGFGTHDEGFEVLTLLQTGKAPPMPVVLMELPGERYWEDWDQFIRRQLLARGFISPEDLSFYKIIRSPEEVIDWITSYYSTYHSMRQVRNKLVIRLEKELTDSQVKVLNDNFPDLIKSGSIYKTKALAEEADEPELNSKSRIAFSYTKKNARRLSEMILMINRLNDTK